MMFCYETFMFYPDISNLTVTKYYVLLPSIQQETKRDSNCGLMVNQQMVEAHKKMVESKLQMEVAHSVTSSCYSDCQGCPQPSLPQDPVEAGEAGDAGQVARLCLARNVKNGSKRFFPHLEQIPEESRHSTFKNSSKKQDGGNFGWLLEISMTVLVQSLASPAMAASRHQIWSTRRSPALTSQTPGVWTVALLQGWYLLKLFEKC